MHRIELLTILRNYVPHDHEEQEAKHRMLQFIQENPRCFERSLEHGHITASAWLLNKDSSQALLMHHAKLNTWVQLGGHCDGDSDVLHVALKEAQEESGIDAIVPVRSGIFDIDIHRIPANSREKEHDHYDVRFLLQVQNNQSFVQNSESKELRWIDKNEASLPTESRSIVRMFYKWLRL
jgi:8-oxo-dGTP pyrophosphatase MutT (NUDIX family)